MKMELTKIVSDKLPHLFSPLQLGEVKLAHRVVMAPLTRMRSRQPGNVPQDINVEYYSQRATNGGLIITEATQISPQGLGYPGTPGIHSAEQVTGWQKVVNAVHDKGGVIFLQLWHVGRISHSSLHADGTLPVAPSAVRPSGNAFTSDGSMVPFETRGRWKGRKFFPSWRIIKEPRKTRRRQGSMAWKFTAPTVI